MSRTAVLVATGMLAVLVPAPAPATAQDAAPAGSAPRPTLEPADYARWESIGQTELSPYGRWLAYVITRVDGDDELRIRSLASDSAIVVPNGARPVFSADGRWLAYAIGVGEEERKRRQEDGEPVRSQVAIMDLASGQTVVIDDIADFSFSGDGASIALQAYGSDGRHDLIVRDLDRGTSTTFGNVAASKWQDGGPLLALIIHTANRIGNGVRTFDPTTGVIRTLASDTAEYTALSWREDDDDLAVLRKEPRAGREQPTHSVIAWRDAGARRPRRAVLDPGAHPSFPSQRRVVDHFEPRWSRDGGTIYIGLRGWADADSAESDNDDAEQGDPAGVAVWHAGDVEIVPERKIQEMYDRSRSWVAAWDVDAGRFVPLADSVVEEVSLSDGRFALGLDPRPWEREAMFGPRYRDLIAIDVVTGERTRFAERVQFQQGISPTGRYVLYLRGGDYWTYDTRTRRHTNITADLPASFVNLQDDHTVEEKPPFGNGGWTTGDRSVLLYDRYDIWEVRPDGSAAVNLTSGAADRIRHRRAWLNPDDRVVDPSRPIYVTLYGDRTKQFGYGRIRPGGGVERLVLLDRNVGRLTRADSADVYMYRVEGFADSPDLFVGGPLLADADQVTATNPFQDEYAWGRSELIDFTNATGTELQAALFYPADYEPGRSYPMIVDIYEITSNTLHTYSVPSERSAYNTTVFTQNGYFVLRPDIVYRGRDPGVSAVEALVPAVEAVIARGLTERGRIGLLGHSWGGYQTAFTVTQTDLFGAAVAGAPLTNLISMYLSVFWNTGTTDARIFEIDQARMEVPFWEDLDAYMRNSPLFSIQKLDTPLLVAFGDEDGAVDWHQGIELYNAARRAGKQMVLLVYEGENHSLGKESNQRDYHRRIMQWFDHYLKGAPAPDWITKGMAQPGK